jgi:hypothetical protein
MCSYGTKQSNPKLTTWHNLWIHLRRANHIQKSNKKGMWKFWRELHMTANIESPVFDSRLENWRQIFSKSYMGDWGIWRHLYPGMKSNRQNVTVMWFGENKNKNKHPRDKVQGLYEFSFSSFSETLLKISLLIQSDFPVNMFPLTLHELIWCKQMLWHSSIFIVSESLFSIRSHRQCTISKSP